MSTHGRVTSDEPSFGEHSTHSGVVICLIEHPPAWQTQERA